MLGLLFLLKKLRIHLESFLQLTKRHPSFLLDFFVKKIYETTRRIYFLEYLERLLLSGLTFKKDNSEMFDQSRFVAEKFQYSYPLIGHFFARQKVHYIDNP